MIGVYAFNGRTIFMPFAPHFAALCLVFSTKMHCI